MDTAVLGNATYKTPSYTYCYLLMYQNNGVVANYTTKIDTFVCSPHISETVPVRIMKLAHRSRIASTTKRIISKQMLLSILSILFKTIQPISAGPSPYTSTDTCLPRERSVAMTTSSSSRPAKLQRRAVKERRQLTLSSVCTCRDRMFPFLATELNRQQRKGQRFNLLTIKG